MVGKRVLGLAERQLQFPAVRIPSCTALHSLVVALPVVPLAVAVAVAVRPCGVRFGSVAPPSTDSLGTLSAADSLTNPLCSSDKQP